jgi:beta-galactosidase/beta-glucuronidase
MAIIMESGDQIFFCCIQQFLANIKEEVRQAVRRLAHHPSIVMWIGNNENQVGNSIIVVIEFSDLIT